MSASDESEGSHKFYIPVKVGSRGMK
jgi:hypothetical protein